MIEVIKELSEIIGLLEAEIPASMAKPENQKLEQGLARSLAEYFKRLDQGIDITALEQIYNRWVEKE